MINAWWYNAANVGDLLTPFILERLLRTEVTLSHEPPKWLVSGSILHDAQPGDTLCGVGSFNKQVRVYAKDVRVVLLRGPLTAAKLGTHCDVYGDAGLLLPSVYNNPQHVDYEWGIVPHYMDEVHLQSLYRDNQNWKYRIIPVSLKPADFIDAVRSCKHIASSSLHGIVIAEAYGIPAVRIEFPTSRMIWDFEYKHEDYYAGTYRKLPAAVPLVEALARTPTVSYEALTQATMAYKTVTEWCKENYGFTM